MGSTGSWELNHQTANTIRLPLLVLTPWMLLSGKYMLCTKSTINKLLLLLIWFMLVGYVRNLFLFRANIRVYYLWFDWFREWFITLENDYWIQIGTVNRSVCHSMVTSVWQTHFVLYRPMSWICSLFFRTRSRGFSVALSGYILCSALYALTMHKSIILHL